MSMEDEFHSATSQISQQKIDGLVLLRRLSAAGYIPASYELGNCFYIGNLVEKSEHKAVIEWRKAAGGGHIYAKINVIKYEWHHASKYRKVFLTVMALSVIARAAWLIILSDGHDPKLMGNTDPSLKQQLPG